MIFASQMLEIQKPIKIHDAYSTFCKPVSIWGICYKHAHFANDNYGG